MMHPCDMMQSRAQYSPYPDAFRRPAATTIARRPEPEIDTSRDIQNEFETFVITVRAPQGYKCEDASASRRGDARLKVEGTLVEASHSSISTYVTRTRATVYAEPSTRAGSLLDIVPAGRIVRGSAPSSHGWIALCSPEDDESELYMRDDGSLALIEDGSASQNNHERTVPFAKHIDLPSDVDIARGTSTPNDDGSLTIRVPVKKEKKKLAASRTTRTMDKFRVVHNPHVYVRAAPNLRAAAICVKRVGDVVRVLEEVDGWLKLADNTGWMLRDGSALGLGALLQPVFPPAPHENGAPARPPPHRTPAHGYGQFATTASVPVATKAKASSPPQCNGTGMPRAVERKKKVVSRPAGIDALRNVGEPSALLRECSASTANVQRPVEATEHWVAMDDGSFAPLAIA